jgi:hypothetical protein
MTFISEGEARVSSVRLTCLVNIAHPNQGGKLQCGTHVGMPERVDDWPLTRLQQHLVKTGGRLIKHARYDCRVSVG